MKVITISLVSIMQDLHRLRQHIECNVLFVYYCLLNFEQQESQNYE